MSDVLSNLSDDLSGVVSTAGKSVVRVEARRRHAASGVVWSNDGLIVTANHVVDREDNIRIGLDNGETIDASLVGRDPTTDIAVLRTESGELAQASWTDTDDLRVGHLVLALGRPRASVAATLGIVGALGDSWRTPGGGQIDRYLQTDVTMYPGFSGGPLVDVSGQVLGITTSGILRGVSITVPTQTIRQVVDTLLKHGKVRRGYLGIGAQPVRLSDEMTKQLDQETGVMISSIETSGPADTSGLLLGDIVVAVNGQSVEQLDDLLGQLTGDRVGSTLPVRIIRGGVAQELKVTVGERN